MILPSTNDELPSEPALRSIELGLERLQPSLARLSGELSLVDFLAQTAADGIGPDEPSETQSPERRPDTVVQQGEDWQRAGGDNRGGGAALVQVHDAIASRSDDLPPPFGVPPEAFPGLLPSAAGAAVQPSDVDRQPRDLVELAGRLDEAALRGSESVAGKLDREIRDGVASLVHDGVKIKNPEAFDRQARFV